MSQFIPLDPDRRGSSGLHGAEQRLSLQYAVSSALAESETIEDAAQRVLQHVGRYLGWARAAYWEVDEAAQVLRPAALWSAAGGTDAYSGATAGLTLRVGEGLPGVVAQRRESLWVTDVEHAFELRRRDALLAENLRGGFAFPVTSADSVVAVIEFFSHRPEPVSDVLLEVTQAIGHQIGQFIARKKAAESQRAAESRNATIVEIALDGVVTIDRNGRVMEWNPAAERMFGYVRHEVLGRQMAELIIPPLYRAQHYAGLERYLRTGEARVLDRRIEVEGMRRDGTTFPVELAIVRIPGSGAPVFTSYLRDLTEERRAATRQKLLLDASTILGSSLDYEETLRNIGRVVVPPFADWYFVDVSDSETGEVRRLHVAHRNADKVALAKEVAERFPDTSRDRGVQVVLRTGRTDWLREIRPEDIARAAVSAEHEAILRRLGLRSYIVAPLVAHGRTLGAIGFVTAESGRLYDERDVAVAEDLGRRAGQAVQNALLFRELTQQRELLSQQQTELETQAAELEEAAESIERANDELRRRNEELHVSSQEALFAKEEADQANKTKSAFLAAMSHELRTPLNAILGYADLLSAGIGGGLTDEQHERLARIQRSAHHLLTLINDILNFARLEAGRMMYEIRPVAASDVLKATEVILAPLIGEKGIRFTVRTDCGDVKVCADREKLLQILINLLNNAVKHTPANGEIAVFCERRDSRIRFCVRDTGPGIAEDKREEIFQPFTQLEATYVGHRQGTGLGLSISRELAHAMKGDVTVTSEVGRGSTFMVTLPAA